MKKIIKLAKKLIKFEWLKKSIGFIKSILRETLAQTFTLLGFFIAWLTLTGAAKDIVGVAIIISLSLWLLTIRFRD